jgi:ankyrin repeat protein
MFDPTPPVTPSRTQSRMYSQNNAAARRTTMTARPEMKPATPTPAEDDIFAPPTARRGNVHANDVTPATPDTTLSHSDPMELERPKGPVVVIGRPTPTPPAVKPNVPAVSRGNPASPPINTGQQAVATNVRPEMTDPGVSASLVDRQPDVRAERVTKTNPPKPQPATKPVETASVATEPNAAEQAAKPEAPAPAIRPVTPEQLRLRARVAELKAQLKSGTEVDERDERGRTLLQQAAIAGELEVAETLLDSGANLKAQDAQGWTALHWAASSGHPEICELLIASGAPIDARGFLGDSPLQWAATFDRRDVAELLLARGADVNAADKRGRTALHAAIEGDAYSTVKVLLAHGADLGARDAAGLSPLHQAIFQCKKTMEEADVPDAGEASPASARLTSGDRRDAKQKALDRGCEMVRLLLGKGAQVNAASDRGVTPLHVAAWDEMTDVAEILIAAGADRTAKDERDLTPADYAKGRKQQTAMRLLNTARAAK